jgi:hypothetical protein
VALAHLQPAFTSGEVSPSLFGRFDLARLHTAMSTGRNGFVSYRGGFYSRAGTAFAGFSKQTGRAYPPRMITFQFSINQGLALEFGNYYMRVLSNGGFVTEPGVGITNITQANPGVLTLAAFVAASATPNNAAVSASYAPGDQVTLAGGTFTQAAILKVTNTTLLSVAVNAAGGSSTFPAAPPNPYSPGYIPGCTISLSGGIATTQAQAQVLTTKVTGAAVVVNGSGGTPGTRTMQGTTGTGTKFQATVTVSGAGHITAVLAITVGGSYTVNPTLPNAEPVTDITGSGSNVTGAKLLVEMGVGTVSIINGGVFTSNPVGGALTQSFCSAPGAVGATFNTAILGPSSLSVANPGVYSVVPANPVAQASTTGTGAGATFAVNFGAGSSFATGDWVSLSQIGGMTQLNGLTVVLTQLTSTTYSMADAYGNPINTTALPAYTVGGLASRIYTLQTPYAEQDLPYLKFTQSADVMSLCLVNQQTLVEYQPQDLTRNSNTNWSFSPVVPATAIAAPTGLTAATTTGGSHLQYVVTAVDPVTGTESVASTTADVACQDPAAVNFTIRLNWTAVAGVTQYNIYKAPAGIGTTVPVGSLFGYVGSSYGPAYNDQNNTVPDFTQTPPLHRNPFAPGQVIGVPITAAGTSYTQAGITYSITTATGSGLVLTPIVEPPTGGSGTLVGFVINDPGQNYEPGDTITITADGSNATATLTIGPETGTNPGVVSYVQARRAYGYSLNNPDTYWMSKPGDYTNFDVRIPTISSDAITGSPWAVEVNGIQAMNQMPGGLIVFTGLGAWQLTGTGGSSFSPQPIGPDTQQVQPQGYNGCAPTILPIKIENGIVYVQSKGSIYREVQFNISQNQYYGGDMTINSSHLFTGYTIKEHAWCEEPYKLLWAIRSDGVLLSCTYLKSQEVLAWARADTQGLFQSVCSVTELPVDAAYFAVQRFIGGNNAYMIERMNNRIWATVENVWAVDAGLGLAQPTPAATLSASSATGLGAIPAGTVVAGGAGYSAATQAFVVDMGVNNDGKAPGTGAAAGLTIVGGVITGVAFPTVGANYVRPRVDVVDPAGSSGGSGAVIVAVLDNSATFSASAAVFSVGNVGSVIRMGGGIATVIQYVGPQKVVANITSPITQTFADGAGTPVPIPQASGAWTLTAPVSSVRVPHLAGATVTGLYDGNVIPLTVAAADGTIVLPAPATSVTVGLGFQAQLQSVYLDGGDPTIQGQRKKIAAVTLRIEASRGLKAGSNQVDGSTVSPMQIAPQWVVGDGGLTAVDDKALPPYGSSVIPLFTGDTRIVSSGGFGTHGQVAVQQDFPLPMNILALVGEASSGDSPQDKWPQKAQKQQGRAA